MLAGLPSALRFARASFSGPPGAGSAGPRAGQLVLPGEALDVDEYLPPGPPRCTVLFVHGMSPRGHRDPRLMHAAGALAAAGCRVLAPGFPEVMALRLSPKTEQRIVGCVRALGGRVALFSVSFSGSLCLRAAATLGDQVSALLLLGAAARPRSVLRTAMEDPLADPYVWWLSLAAWLPELVPGAGPVAEVLRGAVLDDSLQREPAQAPLLRARLTDEQRELLEALESPRERARIAAPMWDGPRLEALCPMGSLAEIRAPVALLHGRGDRVIPAAESRHLWRALANAGVPARLAITELLTHGDVALGARAALGVPALLSTLAFWFEAAEGG